jgi:tRNA threonylcarbamoyladenosine biosynthesis protein TsaE
VSTQEAETTMERAQRPAAEAATTTTAADAAATRAAGSAFAQRLHAGDLVILSGELGAGKTTFTQGLAEGLGVRGPITSPTFVLARVHPSLVGGPALVHVDAYRLGSLAELDDLDLDASFDESVTVVEWGEGRAEVLAEGGSGHYLVRLDRSREDDVREITVARL